jgi:dihydroxyacetone synthase
LLFGFTNTTFQVIDVLDGSNNVKNIVQALRAATKSPKPTFINIRTVIGQDTAAAGTAKAHHGALDWDSIRRIKRSLGVDSESTYTIPTSTLSYFRKQQAQGQELQDSWNRLMLRYSEKHAELGKAFSSRVNGYAGDFEHILGSMDSSKFKGMATRESNGIILQKLWDVCPGMIGGGADLITSNKFSYSETDVFSPNSASGRYIRHGIREHAMAAAANGIAAFAPGVFLPVTATFFIFFIYVSDFSRAET